MKTVHNHQAKLFNTKFVPDILDGKPVLRIADWAWWEDNERELMNWMAEHLREGIHHLYGPIITFDTDQERVMFLLKWG